MRACGDDTYHHRRSASSLRHFTLHKRPNHDDLSRFSFDVSRSNGVRVSERAEKIPSLKICVNARLPEGDPQRNRHTQTRVCVCRIG